MITKREFAEYLVRDFVVEHARATGELLKEKDLHNYICESTSLGIALDFLGRLTEKEAEYIRKRAGIFIVAPSIPVPHILTTKEMFDLLPDEFGEEG